MVHLYRLDGVEIPSTYLWAKFYYSGRFISPTDNHPFSRQEVEELASLATTAGDRTLLHLIEEMTRSQYQWFGQRYLQQERKRFLSHRRREQEGMTKLLFLAIETGFYLMGWKGQGRSYPLQRLDQEDGYGWQQSVMRRLSSISSSPFYPLIAHLISPDVEESLSQLLSRAQEREPGEQQETGRLIVRLSAIHAKEMCGSAISPRLLEL